MKQDSGLKIALIGYGKLGREIEAIAIAKGHHIVTKVDSSNAIKTLTAEGLNGVDVCIDFSSPGCVVDNIKKIATLRKPIVVGTTGWYDRLDEMRQIVLDNDIGFLYAPNFSIGVLLFMHMVADAAKLMDRFDEYDVAAIEMHHNAKKDSPSGTAGALAQLILNNLQRKDCIIHNLEDEKIASNQLHVTSVRCGNEPGSHTIVFDSPSDSITLTHRARNRAGFAIGAITAAAWIKDKKGFFSLEDMLATI
jgi:4-hydroxy-tetrahydrodipicolinate reductase